VSDAPILVIWRDAWFEFDHDETEERADYLVETVGWIVDDGPKFLSIAQERLPNGDGFRAVTHIPKSCVVNNHQEGLTWLTPRAGNVGRTEP
jgi:hypothetical protein